MSASLTAQTEHLSNALSVIPPPIHPPPLCRPYLVNLLPCLTRITKRQEETVQETLALSIPKIMSALGHFANDGEIKVSLACLFLAD